MSHPPVTGDPGLPEPADNIADLISEPDDAAASDAESFADTDEVNDPAQDADDADPTAPLKSPFDDGHDQAAERRREVRGNLGPDEIEGFGQGA